MKPSARHTSALRDTCNIYNDRYVRHCSRKLRGSVQTYLHLQQHARRLQAETLRLFTCLGHTGCALHASSTAGELSLAGDGGLHIA